MEPEEAGASACLVGVDTVKTRCALGDEMWAGAIDSPKTAKARREIDGWEHAELHLEACGSSGTGGGLTRVRNPALPDSTGAVFRHRSEDSWAMSRIRSQRKNESAEGRTAERRNSNRKRPCFCPLRTRCLDLRWNGFRFAIDISEIQGRGLLNLARAAFVSAPVPLVVIVTYGGTAGQEQKQR